MHANVYPPRLLCWRGVKGEHCPSSVGRCAKLGSVRPSLSSTCRRFLRALSYVRFIRNLNAYKWQPLAVSDSFGKIQALGGGLGGLGSVVRELGRKRNRNFQLSSLTTPSHSYIHTHGSSISHNARFSGHLLGHAHGQEIRKCLIQSGRRVSKGWTRKGLQGGCR